MGAVPKIDDHIEVSPNELVPDGENFKKFLTELLSEPKSQTEGKKAPAMRPQGAGMVAAKGKTLAGPKGKAVATPSHGPPPRLPAKAGKPPQPPQAVGMPKKRTSGDGPPGAKTVKSS